MMAQAALKQQHALPEPTARTITPACGGTVADMQRSIATRMALADRSGIAAIAPADDLAHRVSRLAGPALLVAAYAAVALRLL